MSDVLSILGQLAETSADPRIRNIVKSLSSAQAGTNLSSLTGGGAMRVEALEPELATACVSNPHFVLFNHLFPNRHTSFSLLDQVVVQDGIGGFPGSSISNERGTNQSDRNGSYKRVVTELKVFSEFGGVTVPTALQGAMQQSAGVVDFNAAEQEVFSALSRILQSVEWSLINGDATVNVLETTGLVAGIKAGAPGNVVDLLGVKLESGSQIAPLAARLAGYGNWGSPDMILCSPGVKADFDAKLESGYRVNLDANIPSTVLGTLVKGIRYNGMGVGNGILEVQPHVFLDENLKAPVESYSADVTAAPATTIAGVASGATGKFGANNGTYVYRVEACNAGSVSATVASAAVTVANTNFVTLTITANGDTALYYNVYRGRKGALGAVADVRFIGRIVKAGATTPFVDSNDYIPGTSEAIILTSAPQFNALKLVQMAPPAKLPLAMTTLEYRFAIMYIAALRLALPKKHGLIKNILPANATWTPYA